MGENKIVTLNVKTKEGVKHIRFEVLKRLDDTRCVLFANDRLYIGRLISWGAWSLTSAANLDEPIVFEQECAELYTKPVES